MTTPNENKTTHKPVKKTRERNPVPVISDVLPVEDDEVAASFRASVVKTAFHKTLDALESGQAIKAKGDITRIRVSVNTFEKKIGGAKSFNLVQSVKDPAFVIIQRAKDVQASSVNEDVVADSVPDVQADPGATHEVEESTE